MAPKRGLPVRTSLKLLTFLPEFRCRLRPLARRRHPLLEPGPVDAHPLIESQLLDQVERDAKRVVETEDGVARQRRLAPPPKVRDRLADAVRAGRHGLDEPHLLVVEHLLERQDPLTELIRLLEVGPQEDPDDRVDQLVQKRPLDTETSPVSRGATDDPAQDVAASLV